MAVGTTAFPTSLDTVVELVEITNNASSTLSGNVLIGDTTIGVTDISEFPTTGYGTIVDDLTSPTKVEIISWTGKSGSNLTGCTRGTQGTSAAAFSSGNYIEVRPTAGHHEALRGAVIAIETKLGTGSTIAVNKLAALTASRAVVTDGSGFISAATTTAAEIGYLAGVTTPTGSGALVLATSPTLTTPTIAKLANLTSNGFVKTSGGDGTLSVDTSTYLTANQSISLSGDVTGSGSTAITTTIASGAVTYAKIQNISATSRILARKTAGAGSAEECTLSDVLDFIGSAAQGDILYRGASGWARLGAGTSGHYLQTQGAAANPQWAAVSGGGLGTVTSVGLSLPGMFTVTNSPVTTAGTLTATLADQAANKVFAGPTSGGATTPTFRSLVSTDIPDLSSTYATAGHTHSTLTSLYLNGTAGAGYLEMRPQSSAPAAPAAGFALFADSTGRFGWIRAADGYIRKWDASLTGDRTYTLPDVSGTVVTTGNLSAITKLASLTSNGFVKTSGGDGTLSVDTSTYLTANQSITLSGDVTGSGSTAITTTIASAAVTYAKIQNVSAQYRILARKSASAGSVEECTLSEVLDFVTSAAQGDILYRGAANWERLGAGTNGHFLKTQGAAANPTWAAAATTSNKLSDFAATTSAELAGVISDETGSGVLVFGTSPAITTSLTTASASFDLLNANATTINFGGAATALNMAGGSGAVVKLGGGANAASLRFMEPSGSGTNYTEFKAQAQAGDVTYTLPAADGSNGQVLSTNGSGTLSWATSGGGLTIGTTAITSGTAGRILYETSGNVVGETAGFTFQPAASPNLTITAQAASYVGLRINSAATPSVDIFQATVNGGAGTGFVVTSTGAPSSPGAGSNSERYGSGATSASSNSVVIGNGATGTGGGANVVIGQNAASSGAAGVMIGRAVSLTVVGPPFYGIVIGDNSQGGGTNGITIGNANAISNNGSAIVLGHNNTISSSTLGTFFVVSNGSSTPITDWYSGKGPLSATPTAYTINGTGGSGSNIAGADINIAGGKGTGTGATGKVNLQIARPGSTGSSLNTLTTAWSLNGTATATDTTMTGGNGQTTVTGSLSESVTLSTSGTTTDSTIDLPANSIILSVTGRITTTITTATDWKLGDATISDRFSDANATLTAGTTTVGINQWKADRTTAGQGAFQQSTAKVRITTTGTPGAGVIRITIHYITLSAPTS